MNIECFIQNVCDGVSNSLYIHVLNMYQHYINGVARKLAFDHFSILWQIVM